MSIAELKRKLAERKQDTAQNDDVHDVPVKPTLVNVEVSSDKAVSLVAGEIPDLEQVAQEVVAETAEKQLKNMNKSFFVAPHGGKVCIFQESWNYELDRSELAMHTQEGFRLLFKNRLVTYKDQDDNNKTVPLADYWLSHKLRSEYPNGIALLPHMKVPPNGVYNLFKGFGVLPEVGDAEPALKHIKHVICGGAHDLAGWVVCWFAFCVQFPEKAPGTALVLRGGRGTGKGTVINWMLRIFGVHGMQISQSRHLTGNFNAHLRSLLFLFADEAFFAGDKSAEGVQKAIITESTLAVEQKGVDVVTVVNRLKLAMASNNDWVIPAGYDERRYCVIDVSDRRKQDHTYFAKLNDHMDNKGGLEAFLDFLLKVDLSQFNVRAVPSTKALEEQKLLTMPPIASWLYTRLTEERLTRLSSDWQPRQLRDAICEDFAEFVKAHGYRYEHLDSATIGKKLRELIPELGDAREASGNRRGQWLFPSLEVSRQAFANRMGLEHLEWPTERVD